MTILNTLPDYTVIAWLTTDDRRDLVDKFQLMIYDNAINHKQGIMICPDDVSVASIDVCHSVCADPTEEQKPGVYALFLSPDELAQIKSTNRIVLQVMNEEIIYHTIIKPFGLSGSLGTIASLDGQSNIAMIPLLDDQLNLFIPKTHIIMRSFERIGHE